MTVDARLRVYLPNGADQGILPTPSSWDASFPLNDVGALTLGYAAAGGRAALLGQPLEVAVEVSTDGGVTFAEPRNGRYLYLQDGRDTVQDTGWQVNCPGYIKRLTKALVPLTSLNSSGQREFNVQTIGAILNTLFTEAQARGAMTGLSWNFTAANDSSGTAWGATKTVAYEAGRDFLSIIQDWADLGDIDYTIQGRQIQVYRGGALGTDKTTGANPVSLRKGRDLTEGPFQRTWEGLADTAFVQGDGGSTLTRTNAGAVKPWGRQEQFVTAAGVKDAGTLQIIGDLANALTGDQRTEYTHGLAFGREVWAPFTDYEPGTWVYSDAAGGTDSTGAVLTRMRVRQVTLSRSDDGAIQGNVVLNDRFLESDVLNRRRTAALLGGATPTTGGTPVPYGNDILPPGTVAGVSATSAAYVDPGGLIRAQITVDWADLTVNNDGTPMTDLDHYEVWRRPASGTWALMENTDAATSVSTSSPYQPGNQYEFKVRGVDTAGNQGLFSTVATVTASGDVTAPGTPSAPTVATHLGAAQVDWDGLLSGGGALPSDFAYCEVHYSTVTGFTPTKGAAATLAGRVVPGGTLTFGGLVMGVYYCRLILVDFSGNASTPGAQTSFTIQPILNGELSATAVDAMTVTGAVIQTVFGLGGVGVSGLKIENDVSGGVIKWYSGISGETPGFLNPGASAGRELIAMQTGAHTGNTRAYFDLLSGNVNGALPDDRPQAYFDEDLHLFGDFYIDGTNRTGSPTPRIIMETGLILDFCIGSLNSSLRLSNPTNVAAKLSTAFGSGGVSINLQGTQVTIGVQSYNATAATAANTGSLHAADIHSWTGGLIMEDLSGGGTTAASIGNGGRVIRTTSSRRYKDDIRPMDLALAFKALDLEPVTFTRRDEADAPNRHRYPGVIAEQAHEAGLTEWVSYDSEGKPDGFRYGELTAAHTLLLQDLFRRVEALETGV